MKRDEYVFYKVGLLSLCLGFIIGMALGLLVFCPVVHAETTGVWAYPLGRGEFVETGMACTAERVGYSYLTADHQLLFCYGEKGWGIVNFIEDIPCLATMEAAMRAMDEFVYRDPPLTTTTEADLCVYSAVCRAARELDRVQRRTDAITQWEQAKACWRKP